MIARRPSAAIAGQLLRELLVEYRKRAGLTQADVIRELDWSESKIHRVENGPQLPQTSDVIAMLALFGITGEAGEDVVQLARDSKGKTFSSTYKRVISRDFGAYLDYELYADKILSYETKFVPGQVQQGDYAMSVLRYVGEHKSDEAEEIAKLRRDLREDRATKLIEDPDGPEIFFIIDEGALHHAFGGEDAGWTHRYDSMLRVFKRLDECNTIVREGVKDLNPRISIQIVPFEYGAYKPYRGPFVILDFDATDVSGRHYTEKPRVYLENPTSEVFTADQKLVEEYSDMFARLRQDIPGPEVTSDILAYIANQFKERLEAFPTSARVKRLWL